MEIRLWAVEVFAKVTLSQYIREPACKPGPAQSKAFFTTRVYRNNWWMTFQSQHAQASDKDPTHPETWE